MDIRGAGGGGKGGGGGGGSRATVERDGLESAQFARIIDLLSEGEIEGFSSARNYQRGTAEYNRALLKDIFFNNTPMVRAAADPSQPYQNSDFNFRDVTVSPRYGTQNQTYLTEIGNTTQQEFQVGAKITQATPVTRSITNANVNAVRVTISVPQLQIYESDGDVRGRSVDLQIQLSYNGGPFSTVLSDTITGRTTDLYQRKYRIELTQAPPVEVRVVRVTPDAPQSAQDTILDEIFWASYTELISAKTAFPNSALIGLLVSAEQFSSIPQRAYRIRGIKVAIPSNATVDSTTGRLIYNGVWNGSFASAQWCSDPAWILWDLLTSKRYGFGDHVTTEQLDKWSFFAASQYSSALVPDGFGGQEPRFSCNVNIQTQEEAFKLISDLSSVMRAMPYWATGSLTIAQDAGLLGSDAVYAFNQSNVTEDGFSYSGSSLKTRHTVAVVSYLDLDARNIAYEVVEDKTAIDKFGVVKTEVSAFACTSRGQARRLGEWLLYSEQNETEVVSFITDMAAGITVRPGDVIKIADPTRAGVVRAGRCTSGSTTTSVPVDRQLSDIYPGGVPAGGFTLNVMLPDGSIGIAAGSTMSGTTITPGIALTQAPRAGAPYSIDDSTVQLQLFRVIGLQESDGTTYTITAVSHNDAKYDYIERDVPLTRRDVSDLNEPPETPTNLSATEVLYESNGQVLSKIIVGWAPSIRAQLYEFRHRLDSGNFSFNTTRAIDTELANSAVGTYTFEVIAISASNKRSEPATLAFNAIGKTAPPQTIPDLFIAPIDQHNAELYWPQATDLDVRVGGQVRIRHSPLVDGSATWGRANDIVPAVNGSSTRKIVPLLEGTYLIRAVDSLGNESAGVASVVVDLPAPQDTLLIQEYREEDNTPPFNGTGTDMAYSETELGLILASGTLVDGMATDGNWDALGLIDYIGGAVSQGNYQFSETLDLGGVYDIELRAILQTRAFEPGNTWDDRLGLIDLWDDIDGDDLGGANCQLYVRTTSTAPAGSPTWATWQPFVNNTQRGRGFQFKLVANSSNPAQNVVVEQLGVVTQFERRTEAQRNLTSGAGSYTITFPTAFYGTPSIGITAQDMDTGDYFTVSSATRAGFSVTFRNSAGSIVSKTFDYQAVGHGREIT